MRRRSRTASPRRRARRSRGDVFHPITHALIGWAVAHCARVDRRTRLWCLIASVVPDLDGLTLLAGLAAYGTYHHVLTHNLAFGLVVTAVSAVWVPRRARDLALVFAAFCSHLIGDYFGSGPGWGLQPFLPFSNRFFLFERAWELGGWQNMLITVIAIGVALVIAVRAGRTPLEFIHARTDHAIVDALRARFSASR